MDREPEERAVESPKPEKLSRTKSSLPSHGGLQAWWGAVAAACMPARGTARGTLPLPLSLFLRRALHTLRLWMGPDPPDASAEGAQGGVKKSPSTTKLGPTASARRRLLRLNVLPLLWVACVFVMLFVQMFSPSIVPSIRRSEPVRDVRASMEAVARAEEASGKGRQKRKVKEAAAKKKHGKEDGKAEKQRDGKEKGKQKEKGGKEAKGSKEGPRRGAVRKPGSEQGGKVREASRQAKPARRGSDKGVAELAVVASSTGQQGKVLKLDPQKAAGTRAVQGRGGGSAATGAANAGGRRKQQAAGLGKGAKGALKGKGGVSVGLSPKGKHALLERGAGTRARRLSRTAGASGKTAGGAGRTAGRGTRGTVRAKRVRAKALAKTAWRPIPGARFVRAYEATSFRRALYCVSTHGQWAFDARPRLLPWPVSPSTLGQCERRLLRRNRAKLAYWRADRVAEEIQAGADKDDPGAWSRWDVRPSAKWTWQVNPAMCHLHADDLRGLPRGQLPEVRRDRVCRLLLGGASANASLGGVQGHRVILIVGDTVQEDFAMAIVAAMLVGLEGQEKEDAVRFVRSQDLPCDWPRLRHKRVCWGAELCGSTGLGSVFLVFVRNDLASLVHKPKWDPTRTPQDQGPEFELPWITLLPQLHSIVARDFASAAEFTGTKSGLAHLRYTAQEDPQAQALGESKHEDVSMGALRPDEEVVAAGDGKEGAKEGATLGLVSASLAKGEGGNAASSETGIGAAQERTAMSAGGENGVGAMSASGSTVRSASEVGRKEEGHGAGTGGSRETSVLGQAALLGAEMAQSGRAGADLNGVDAGGSAIARAGTDGITRATGDAAGKSAGASGSSTTAGSSSSPTTAGAASGIAAAVTGSASALAGITGATAGTSGASADTKGTAAGFTGASDNMAVTAGNTGATAGTTGSGSKTSPSSDASRNVSTASAGAARESTISSTAAAGTTTSPGSASKASADVSKEGSTKAGSRTGMGQLMFQWATGVVDPTRGRAITRTVKRRRALLAVELGAGAGRGAGAQAANVNADVSKQQILEVAEEGRVLAAGAQGDVSSHVSVGAGGQGSGLGAKVRHLTPVVVLNRGLHAVQGDTFWPQLNRTLRYARSSCPGCMLIFRNTAAPHRNCSRAKRPWRKRTQLGLTAPHAIQVTDQSRSLELRRLVETVGGVLLDVEAMTALRPDGHVGFRKKGPPDCTRYCAPGPVDFWTKLLFHALHQML